MSCVNFLGKLLDGVTVEWKTLGEMLVRTKGTKITAGQMKDLHKDGAPIKIFAGGKTVALIDFDDIPLKDVNHAPSVIVKSRGVIAFEYYDKPFSHKNEMWSYHSINKYIHIKYVYHFLKLNEPHFQKVGSKMQMPQIATPDTDNFEIPIPCPDNPEKSLAIQSEIVRILDKFTVITAELTAELTMREKQYDYYRDQLLSFAEGEVEFKSLDDICTLISTGGDVPENCVKGQTQPTNEHPYPVYANATDEKALYGYTDSYKIDSDAVTISARGAKVGYHTVREAKFTPIIRLIVLVANKNLVRTRYLNYILDMTSIGGTDGGIPQITIPMIKKIIVPIPFAHDLNRSLAEQDRIIGVIDKFEVLTHSITEGLPREIELRQKQYEYYRDFLFSFPKLNVMGEN